MRLNEQEKAKLNAIQEQTRNLFPARGAIFPNNLFNHLLLMGDSYSRISSFLLILKELKIDYELNNKIFLSDVSIHNFKMNDIKDNDAYMTLNFRTLNSDFFSTFKYSSIYDKQSQDIAFKFLIDMTNTENPTYQTTKVKVLFKQLDKFIADIQNLNTDELLEYSTSNYLTSVDLSNINTLSFIANLNDEQIVEIIDLYIKKGIFNENFLVDNYKSSESFLHDLASKGHYNSIEKLIEKYSFPVKDNCHFLAKFTSKKEFTNIVDKFGIDIYNSSNSISILKEEEDLLSPYEYIVKNVKNTSLKNFMLESSVHKTIQSTEDMELISCKEFLTFIKTLVTKKSVLEYLNHHKPPLNQLHKFCTPDSKQNILSIIEDKSFWWLLPILSENNGKELKNDMGFSFFTSLNLISKFKYENVFKDNYHKLLNKDIIEHSLPELKAITHEMLTNPSNSNLGIFHCPEGFQHFRNYKMTNRVDAHKLDFLNVNYFVHYGQAHYHENFRVFSTLKFIAKELPYINDDILDLNNKILTLCNDGDKVTASLTQLTYIQYCLKHYCHDDTELFNFKDIKATDLLNVNLKSNEDLKYSQVNINEHKIKLLIANIETAKTWFPDSLHNQELETMLKFQEALEFLFSKHNDRTILNENGLSDNDLNLVTKIIEFCDSLECKEKLFDSENLRVQTSQYFNENKNDSTKVLGSLVEACTLDYMIPKKPATVKGLKF